MPLNLIPHQPFFEDPNRPPRGVCLDDPEYCHLTAPGDAVWLQFNQTPCGGNAVDDPTFIDRTDGGQLLAEPDFTTVVNWVFNPAEWTHAAGKITHTTGNTGAVLQNAVGMAAGWYKVVVEVTDMTEGSVYFQIAAAASGTSADVVENGTHTFYLEYSGAADQFSFTPSSEFDGAIDSANIYPVTFNSWTIGSPWQPQVDGGLCKTDDTATATATESVGNYISTGELWQCEVTISGYGGVGNLAVKIADQSTDVSGNGVHKVYGTAGANGVIALVAEAGFTGCVTLVDARQLKNDYDFVIDDGATESSLDASDITYLENWITVQMAPENYLSAFGCFYIRVTDSCEEQFGEYIINGTFIGGGSPNAWQCPNWQKNNAQTQFDFNGNQLEFTFTTGASHVKTPLAFNDPQPLYVDNVGQVTNYRITFDIDSITPVVGDGIETELAPSAADMGARLVIYGQTTAATDFTGVGTHTYDVALPAGYGQTVDHPQDLRAQIYGLFDMDNSGLANAGTVVVSNLQIERLAPYEATFETECMKYTTGTGTMLIQGTCTEGIRLGFNWDTNFILSQRVRGRVMTAEYPLDEEQYTYSSGDTTKDYADRSKLWELFLDLASEAVHDTVSVQIQCNNLSIGTTTADAVAYVADADYTPEYERSGASEMAQSRLKIKQKIENTIYNKSC